MNASTISAMVMNALRRRGIITKQVNEAKKESDKAKGTPSLLNQRSPMTKRNNRKHNRLHVAKAAKVAKRKVAHAS